MKKRVLNILLVASAVLVPHLLFGQSGTLGSSSSPVVNSFGRPMAGVDVAICQPLATTAASVTSNLAVLTMASNPIMAGFVAGQTIVVSGFSGADTYFNGGTFTNGTGISGGFTILSVTSTTITYALTHANASATSNGTVLQQGNATTACAGLASVFSDAAMTQALTQPIVTDSFGNWNAFAATGASQLYYVQFYGSGIATSLRAVITSMAGTAVKPASADAIQYVSTTGNDSSDGLSPGTAKATIPAAIAALPLISSQRNGTVKLAGGTYNFSSNLNLTNLMGITFEGVSAFASTPGPNQFLGTVLQFNFTGAGTAGIDISGSNSLTFRNIVFSCGTSTSNAPTVCFLHGRTSGSNGIFDRFENCFIVGWSPWIYYNYRGEQLQFNGMIAEYATTGTPITLSFANTAGITSPNVTFGGVASATQFAFEGGMTSVSSQATAAGSKLLYLDEGSGNISSVRFRGFANLEGANEVFIGDTTGATGGLGDVTLEVITQNISSSSDSIANIAGNAAIWHITGDGSGGVTTTPFTFTAGFRSSTINFAANVASGSCFTAGDALQSVILLDAGGCAGNVTAPRAALIGTNGSSFATALATKSSNYALTSSDSWVNVTGTTTITVPHALTGQRWVVFNSGSNTVTVQADSGNINGGANITLSGNTGREVTCDGTNCFAH